MVKNFITKHMIAKNIKGFAMLLVVNVLLVISALFVGYMTIYQTQHQQFILLRDYQVSETLFNIGKTYIVEQTQEPFAEDFSIRTNYGFINGQLSTNQTGYTITVTLSNSRRLEKTITFDSLGMTIISSNSSIESADSVQPAVVEPTSSLQIESQLRSEIETINASKAE